MIICFAGDLLVRSKVDLAARHYGVEAAFASSAQEAATLIAEHGARASLILLDIDAENTDGIALVRQARESGSGRVVAFCSHVLGELIRAAREAGCHTVMANSTFAASVPGLVAEAAQQNQTR